MNIEILEIYPSCGMSADHVYKLSVFQCCSILMFSLSSKELGPKRRGCQVFPTDEFIIIGANSERAITVHHVVCRTTLIPSEARNKWRAKCHWNTHKEHKHNATSYCSCRITPPSKRVPCFPLHIRAIELQPINISVYQLYHILYHIIILSIS